MGIPVLTQPLSFRSRDWTLLAALALGASVHSLMTFPILPAVLGIVLALQLAVLSAIDIRHWRLPNGLNALLALTGLVLSILVLGSDPVDRVLAIAVGFVFLAALAWLYRHFRGHRGLGLGDAKLLGALGAWVGLLGLPSVVLIAATSGLAFSIARLIFVGGGLNQPLPFGPFLALGGWLVWVYGPLF